MAHLRRRPGHVRRAHARLVHQVRRLAQGRVGNIKPTQKNPPKKPQQMGFWGFFKFLIFYENNTNFSL